MRVGIRVYRFLCSLVRERLWCFCGSKYAVRARCGGGHGFLKGPFLMQPDS